MAQLQQRVFMIFVRPCFVNPNKNGPQYPNIVTKYYGTIYRAPLGQEILPDNVNVPAASGYVAAIPLPELNENCPEGQPTIKGGGIERYNGNTDEAKKGHMPDGVKAYSTPPFNENSWFCHDPWFLHSTWTSFEECKLYVRSLIDLLGFDGVMVANFIPLDLELLPNK